MRSHTTVLAILATLLAAYAPAAAAQHASDITYFRSAYKAMDNAYLHENASGAAAYCTPDFVIVGINGKQIIGGKAKIVQQLASMFHYTSRVINTTTINKCVFESNDALVTNTSDSYLTFTVKGKSSSDHNRTTRCDLWVKTANGWQEKSSTALVSHDYPSETKH